MGFDGGLLYTFILSLRNGIVVSSLWVKRTECRVAVSQNRFHTRQAAVALLKMARATTDPAVAAKLVEAAADLKDQAGELPAPAKPPYVVPQLVGRLSWRPLSFAFAARKALRNSARERSW